MFIGLTHEYIVKISIQKGDLDCADSMTNETSIPQSKYHLKLSRKVTFLRYNAHTITILL